LLSTTNCILSNFQPSTHLQVSCIIRLFWTLLWLGERVGYQTRALLRHLPRLFACQLGCHIESRCLPLHGSWPPWWHTHRRRPSTYAVGSDKGMLNLWMQRRKQKR
jgi:hypothetical protein